MHTEIGKLIHGAVGEEWQLTRERLPYWGQSVRVITADHSYEAVRKLGIVHDVHGEEVYVWLDQQGNVAPDFWPYWKPITGEES